jgi:hypothetical protein
MELSVYGPWSGLPNEIASELFASATFYQLKAGDTLFQTGDKGDGLSARRYRSSGRCISCLQPT